MSQTAWLARRDPEMKTPLIHARPNRAAHAGSPRALVLAQVWVLVSACQMASPQPAETPSAMPLVAASAPATAAPVASSNSPPDEAPPEPQLQSPRDKFKWSRRYPEANAVDVKAWVAAHEVKGGPQGSPCWDVADRVGVPRAPGLLCKVEAGRLPRISAVLYRVDHHRLVTVWTGLVEAWANWLDLTPVLAEDGTSLTLHDGGLCRSAAGESRGKDHGGVGVPGLTKALEEACAALGKYRWTGARYAQALDAAGGADEP